MENRTAEENFNLIQGEICPQCGGSLGFTDEWFTSWGENNTAYMCEDCGCEFTVTVSPNKPATLDLCAPLGAL
jgi:uncharacterized Zn finger protein